MSDSAAHSPSHRSLTARWLDGLDLAPLRTPLVVIAAGVALLLFWWLGDLINFPAEGPFDAAILHQPFGVAKLLLIVVALVVFIALGTLALGRIRYDAGWGVAVFGLMGLRWRGGDGYYSIDDRAPSVFYGFVMETALLAIAAAVVWAVLHWLRERGTSAPSIKRFLELPDPKTRIADRKATSEGLDQKVLALLASAGVTAVVVMLLARTTDETQVFFAVAIGSWAGGAVAHAFVPTRPGPWFWGGPILAALVGYTWAGLMTPPEALATGEPGGSLAALARPLPLDWIGAGVPMSLVGYVRSRTKQYRRIIEAQQS